jgi:hypothetical protein
MPHVNELAIEEAIGRVRKKAPKVKKRNALANVNESSYAERLTLVSNSRLGLVQHCQRQGTGKSY